MSPDLRRIHIPWFDSAAAVSIFETLNKDLLVTHQIFPIKAEQEKANAKMIYH